jgi:hypothetical protein
MAARLEDWQEVAVAAVARAEAEQSNIAGRKGLTVA